MFSKRMRYGRVVLGATKCGVPNPAGPVMSTHAKSLIDGPFARGDYRTAALAGQLQENMLGPRAGVLRFMQSRDPKLGDTALAALAAFEAALGELALHIGDLCGEVDVLG